MKHNSGKQQASIHGKGALLVPLIALVIGVMGQRYVHSDDCTANGGSWRDGYCLELGDAWTQCSGSCVGDNKTCLQNTASHTTYMNAYTCTGSSENSCCKGSNGAPNGQHRSQTAPCKCDSGCITGNWGVFGVWYSGPQSTCDPNAGS